MQDKRSLLNYPHIDKIIFFISALVCIFWIMGRYVNVYEVAVVGILFEIAWLPMLALFIILLVLSILLLIKNKKSFKFLPLYSFLLLMSTMLILTFAK